MSLSKPFFRVYRPHTRGNSEYILDARYALDRFSLLQAYQIIEDDLKEVLRFVEPTKKNRYIYSHIIYELFLRCATEFETNCKRILIENGYKKSRDWSIKDYYKITQAIPLCNFEVRINLWHPRGKILKPLHEWSKGSHLEWYQDYNKVKHDRYNEFRRANLKNLLNAAASVKAILFAQFFKYSMNPYNNETSVAVSDPDGFWYGTNSLFGVRYNEALPPTMDKYDFEWNDLRNQQNAFEKFPFS